MKNPNKLEYVWQWGFALQHRNTHTHTHILRARHLLGAIASLLADLSSLRGAGKNEEKTANAKSVKASFNFH